jgi:IBR domain, a half RING-finger domain/Zinc finger, C3HC4 type (RING finger)
MDNPALKACSEYLSKALSSNSLSLQSGDLYKLLELYSKLIKNFQQKLIISVKPLGHECLHCGKYIKSKDIKNAINLKCSENHFFCSKDCIKRHSLMATNGTLLDLQYVRCPGCFTSINIELINNAFDGKIESLQSDACDRALKSLLDNESRAALFQAKFTCEICCMEYKIEQGITLNCDHRFCEECIKQHVSLLIDSAQVSDEKLKCPSCTEPLTVYEIEDVVGPELYSKYDKFRLRALKLDEIDADEIVFHCPGTDCEYICTVEKNTAEFECPKCKHKCCPMCKEDTHKGSSCEEYQEWKKENSEADKLFNKLLEDEGLLRCPECGAAVQRISGCQYMVCSSNECQGKTFFCYDCGIKLQGDHAPHECKPRWKNNQAPGLFQPFPMPQPMFGFPQIPRQRRRRRRK